MKPLQALFGRGDTGPRRRLTELLGDAAPADVLLVDGSTPPVGAAERDELHGAQRLVVGQDGPGVPFLEDDGRRLPTREGGWPVVVLLDVVDRVLEPAFAIRTASDVLAPGGRLVLSQQVAPDDIAARGGWNALQRLRDTRHTWTPTRRQVRAMAGDAGFVREDEALWDEQVDVSTGAREETAGLVQLYVGALAAEGLTAAGVFATRRLALVLRLR